MFGRCNPYSITRGAATSWLGWILIALGGAVAFFIFTYFIGNPKFWRLVEGRPDEA